MIKGKIYTLIFTATLSLASCSGQITNEQNSKRTLVEVDTAQADLAKAKNQGLLKIYSQAISDYITEVHKQNLIVLDTLFFGKRNNGQPDDFPDITLPESIQSVNIQLIDPELGKKLQDEKKSRVYINLMGWVDDQQASFIFVTFSNGFEHKFDYHVEYQYHSEQKDYALTASRIEVFSK